VSSGQCAGGDSLPSTSGEEFLLEWLQDCYKRKNINNKRHKDHSKKTVDGVDDGDPGSSVSTYFCTINITQPKELISRVPHHYHISPQ
jgi:hypothetical protein